MNERIKELRKMLKLTQVEFASRIGIKQNTLCAYEIGRSNPVPSVIELICREFRVNEQWLRTGEGEMFLPDEIDEIDAISQRYHLGPNATSAIRMFAQLPHDRQEVILSFVRELGTVLDLADSSEDVTADDIAAAEAAYLKSLRTAPSTESFPSPMPGDIKKQA